MWLDVRRFRGVEAIIDRLNQFLGDGHMPVSFVRRLDDGPRSVTATGLANRPRRDLDEFVIGFKEFPILRSYPPGKIGIFLQSFEVLAFLFLGDVQPELQQQSIFAHQHSLEFGDSVHGSVKLSVVEVAFDAVDDGLCIPGAEKDGDFALRGQPAQN